MNQQVTKNQHWVHRGYLKAWTFKNKSVWVYSKNKKRIFDKSIKKIASAEYFYDLPTMLDKSDPELFQALEKFLSVIENKTQPALDSLRATAEKIRQATFSNKEQVDLDKVPADRTLMAFFMTLQYVRTNAIRNFSKESFTAFCKRVFDETAQYTDPKIDPTKWTIRISEDEVKRQHLEMMVSILDFMPSFSKKTWVYAINIHDIPLITSDNPIVKHPLKSMNKQSFPGIDSPGMRLIYPVSPWIAITLYDHRLGPVYNEGDILPLKIETVHEYNELQLRQSDDQIYSCLKDFDWALELCKRDSSVYCKQVPPPHTVFDDELISKLKKIAKDKNLDKTDWLFK